MKCFEYCECASEQRALAMPLTSPILFSCGKEDPGAFSMKTTSLEHTSKHISSYSFMSGDIDKMMYEYEIESDSFSSTKGEG